MADNPTEDQIEATPETSETTSEEYERVALVLNPGENNSIPFATLAVQYAASQNESGDGKQAIADLALAAVMVAKSYGLDREQFNQLVEACQEPAQVAVDALAEQAEEDQKFTGNVTSISDYMN